MSAPHHGGWFSLHSLVEHRVHELKDVRRTKLEGGARTQHRGLVDPLPVDEGVGVQAVRRHGHHAFTVHEVAVVGQDPRAEQLETNNGAGTSPQRTLHQALLSQIEILSLFLQRNLITCPLCLA